jgi:hypothetical protein
MMTTRKMKMMKFDRNRKSCHRLDGKDEEAASPSEFTLFSELLLVK